MRLVLTVTLCLLAAAARPQNDSLWTVWRNEALPDSAHLKAIATLSWKAAFERPDSGLALARMQLELARTTGDPKALYTAYNTLAVGHKMRSDLPAAPDHFNRAKEVARSMTDRGRTAATLSNRSTVHKDLGDLPRALELLHRASASTRSWATPRVWPAPTTTSATPTNG